jgi:hypothetical protein
MVSRIEPYHESVLLPGNKRNIYRPCGYGLCSFLATHIHAKQPHRQKFHTCQGATKDVFAEAGSATSIAMARGP